MPKDTPPPTQQLAYSVADAARQIGFGDDTVWNLIKNGTIAAVHLPGIKRTLVRHSELERFVAEDLQPYVAARRGRIARLQAELAAVAAD